jgi:predicted dehydrogenase
MSAGTLRGAIVGFGEVARHGHWPAFASCDGAEIVAVVDRTEARRELARELAPDIVTCARFEELDGLAIDFIDICTPPSLHPEPMLAAIARKRHVLCEKPFLLDPEVISAAKSRAAIARVAVVPVDNWKYAPIVRAATALLADGAIGQLRRVEIETVRLGVASPADGHVNWRRDPAIAGGGILMDHGWHAIYLALHWFKSPPTAVRASFSPSAERGAEEEAALGIRFDAGEALIALTWNGEERRNTIRLEGTDGEIMIDDDTLRVSGRQTATTVFPEALSAGSHHAAWFREMLPGVVACFRQPELAAPRFHEAVECFTIIDHAYRRTAAGRRADASEVKR